MQKQKQSVLVDISEVIKYYLPVSRRKAIKFVSLYMDTKKIGNRIYVDRNKLEELLRDPNREDFPLHF